MNKRLVSSIKGTLAAYAFNHPSELRDENGTIPADLITINSSAARLKINRNAKELYTQGRTVRFNPCLEFLGAGSEGMDCTVDWVKGNEVCIRFATPLGLGITDLQSHL